MHPSMSTLENARKAMQNEEPFSRVLQQAAEACWERATRHRFVEELAQDTIDDDVFRAYLVQDHVFIDALVRLVARGVASCSELEKQRGLTQFLQVLTSEENDYFERSFDALDVSEADREAATVRPVTYAFEDLFRAAVEEYSYLAIVCALLPVEWTYHDWASWAKKNGKESDRAHVREWIDLHATKEFGEFIEWLKKEADEEATKVSPQVQERLLARFVRAVELEIAFFQDAYVASRSPGPEGGQGRAGTKR